MFMDFSTRAHSCSEDIAQFNQMYVAAMPVFERAQTEFKRRPGLKLGRLAGVDMFLPKEEWAAEEVKEQLKDERMREDAVTVQVNVDETFKQTPADQVETVLDEWKLANPELGFQKLSTDGPKKTIYKV